MSFLHAQLTSDVAGLPAAGSQYSGYCSPKGRLLASFLLWRLSDRVLLQLPGEMCQRVQARLVKYLLRAKARLRDASPQWTLFGVYGEGAEAAVAACAGHAPAEVHAVFDGANLAVTRLHGGRFVICALKETSAALHAVLHTLAQEHSESRWARLEIESGVPWITPGSEDAYIPQMLNLDLLGGVSYGKGCYPGQEIVARTHYLGRVKQRMHRIHLPGAEAPVVGDALFSPALGKRQACGFVVNCAPAPTGEYEALAVIHQDALASDIRWRAIDGPAIGRLDLPYTVPA